MLLLRFLAEKISEIFNVKEISIYYVATKESTEIYGVKKIPIL